MEPDPAARPNDLFVDADTEIEADVEIGHNVVIRGGSRIGSECVVQDNAVIGKRLELGSQSTASPLASRRPTLIGAGARVLSGAIVFAGATLEPGAIAGDQSHIREGSVVGADSVVGRGSAVDNDVRIGSRVRIQTNCYLTAHSVIEDDVFVGPGVVTTNDDTMARHPAGEPRVGVTLRRRCRVGGGAVICPGVEIGEEAFVAAGAVVTADVPARAVVMGVPAHPVRTVPEEDLLERWR
jgi:UDP-2-acetamido-3-amino-2,3-dideoxy-glucuronate N-acetyltransferase